MKLVLQLNVLVLFLLTASCVGPKPLLDYVLSYEAMKQAKKAGAESLSSGWLDKADNTYEKAQLSFADKDRDKARKLFIKARRYYERAENGARVKKFNSGEGPGG